MVETSLGRLQKQVDELNKTVFELKNKLYEEREEKNKLKKQLKDYKNNVEKIIEKAVSKAVEEVKKEYEKELDKKNKRIFELECRLNINSDTSSLPSSKDPIDKPRKEIQNSREKTDKKKGGQPNHKKHKLEKFNDEEITRRMNHKHDECPKCHSNNLITIEVKERDELDFKITVEKIRHEIYTQKCKECGELIKTQVPENLHAECQYGSNTKATIISLYDYGFVAYNRVRSLMYGLSSGEINPSEGYMAKLQSKTGKMLENFTFDCKEKLLKSKLLHWDDTVVRIGDKDKACFRAYSDRQIVLFKAHMAKDVKGMDEDGILQNLTKDTVVMHDHLIHNYCDKYQYQNAECNAHINRKVKGIKVNTKHTWTEELEKLLSETLQKRNKMLNNSKNNSDIPSFSNEELNNILKRYDEIIEKGFVEYKEFKHKYEYTNEENLLEFLRDYKDNITFWMRDFSIPYTNNYAESLLRMIKSKMKISMQFKNLEHARYFANIRSYTETCHNFGIDKVTALKRLFDGNSYTITELLSINENSQNT